MKIHFITRDGNAKDITNLCSDITWSGDLQQAARKLSINMVSPLFDVNIPIVELDPGNRIRLLTDDHKELFSGYIFGRERNLSGQSVSITCYDGLIYLTKSKTSYNFKQKTAEEIARVVCQDVGVARGSFSETNILQSYIAISKAPYEIISGVYKKAGELNNKEYIISFQNDMVNITEKGQTSRALVLDPRTNIINQNYSEDIGNMINKVLIYDDKNNLQNQVTKDEWISSYGVFQEIYQKEAGKDPNTVAKNMFNGIERKGSIDAIGDTGCITGSAVIINEPFTKKSGIFYIESDSHSWKDGKHTMQLVLNFKGLM